jgi:hypothetical protein
VSSTLIVYELFDVNQAYTTSVMLEEMGNKIYHVAKSAGIGWMISSTSQSGRCILAFLQGQRSPA